MKEGTNGMSEADDVIREALERGTDSVTPGGRENRAAALEALDSLTTRLAQREEALTNMTSLAADATTRLAEAQDDTKMAIEIGKQYLARADNAEANWNDAVAVNTELRARLAEAQETIRNETAGHDAEARTLEARLAEVERERDGFENAQVVFRIAAEKDKADLDEARKQLTQAREALERHHANVWAHCPVCDSQVGVQATINREGETEA